MSVWYQKSVEEILQQFDSNPHNGLAESQAQQLMQEFGPNELVERGVKNPWLILFDQFKETMVVILIIAAIISAILGDFKDALAILAIIVINAILGFRQEYQAERAMAALKKMAVPSVRVRRDGHVKEISARLLVPGDIILIEAGNTIPADCRILESVNLRVQEAALTGESEPVAKNSAPIPKQDISLADRHNMLFMGTAVAYGRGQAIVTETGMHTELGGIAELIQAAGSEDTPLQRRLDQLGKSLALAAFVLVIIVFISGVPARRRSKNHVPYLDQYRSSRCSRRAPCSCHHSFSPWGAPHVASQSPDPEAPSRRSLGIGYSDLLRQNRNPD